MLSPTSNGWNRTPCRQYGSQCKGECGFWVVVCIVCCGLQFAALAMPGAYTALILMAAANIAILVLVAAACYWCKCYYCGCGCFSCYGWLI